jgi:hypothetical protein
MIAYTKTRKSAEHYKFLASEEYSLSTNNISKFLSGNAPFSHLQDSSSVLVSTVHVHVQISSNSFLFSITPFAENGL